MYQPMLRLHWKQARFALIPFILAAFGLPLVSIQGMGADVASRLTAYQVLEFSQIWLPFFPLLATAVGATLALSAWNWDHELKHVYALSLPVSRSRYSAAKLLAGATLALVPAIAFWMGARVATAAVELPTGLTAYPDQLALRFLMATLLCYAGCFALAAGTVRTTLFFIGGVTAFLVGGAVLNTFLRIYGDGAERIDLVTALFDLMVRTGGPFDVFVGSWALIDV